MNNLKFTSFDTKILEGFYEEMIKEMMDTVVLGEFQVSWLIILIRTRASWQSTLDSVFEEADFRSVEDWEEVGKIR